MAGKEPFKVIAERIGFTEGPIWTRDERLLVTSVSEGKIYDVAARRKPREVAETTGGPNGLVQGADGAVYVAQNGGWYALGERSVTSAVPGIQVVEGSNVRYLAERLGAPNDLCFGPDGRLYFTDPRGPATPNDLSPGRVYAMSLDGEPKVLAEGPSYTNGIAFGPNAMELYVAETFAQRVLVYPLEDDGLGAPREFCSTKPGFPDGMCFDEDGLLYVAATLAREIQVFDKDGARVESLPCGDESMVTNCCFGGKQGTTLFATDSAGERVLSFSLSVKGLPLFPFR